jgi:hypothetical protein
MDGDDKKQAVWARLERALAGEHEVLTGETPREQQARERAERAQQAYETAGKVVKAHADVGAEVYKELLLAQTVLKNSVDPDALLDALRVEAAALAMRQAAASWATWASERMEHARRELIEKRKEWQSVLAAEMQAELSPFANEIDRISGQPAMPLKEKERRIAELQRAMADVRTFYANKGG